MAVGDIQKRLEEIKNTSLQSLSEAEVLALLQERAALEQELLAQTAAAEAERLAKEKAESEKAKQEALKNELRDKIAELSGSIHPDQNSEELLRIITERKELEVALRALEIEDVSQQESKAPEATDLVDEENIAETEALSTEEAPMATLEEPEPETSTTEEGIVGAAPAPESVASPTTEERFELAPSLGGEYQGYLSELKENINSLGSFLQHLPQSAKKDRAFMLEVAKIDPAYAMHYADKDTLKKDEKFNIQIAGMNNTRNTGNPISEMLPEMRTSAVILEGVKNDFRNVRFVLPTMEDYDEIMDLAKKGALEAVKSLKNAHDINFLVPAVLQKDKKFMGEVKKVSDAILG